MSLVNIHQIQLGSRLAICLYNSSKETIWNMLPVYEHRVCDVIIDANLECRGCHRIHSNQYNIMIIELPKVSLANNTFTILYAISEHMIVSFSLSEIHYDNDVNQLKEKFIESLRSKVEFYKELEFATKTLKLIQ